MYRFIAGLILILLVSSTSAFAASEPFNVNLIIRTPIAIVEVSDLDFGTVELPGAPTLFTVTAAAGPQPAAGAGASAAEFSVTGEALALADLSFLVNPETITDGFTPTLVTLTTSATPVTFPTGNVFVGGSLTVTPAHTIGTYIGVATLTVIYQ